MILISILWTLLIAAHGSDQVKSVKRDEDVDLSCSVAVDDASLLQVDLSTKALLYQSPPSVPLTVRAVPPAVPTVSTKQISLPTVPAVLNQSWSLQESGGFMAEPDAVWELRRERQATQTTIQNQSSYECNDDSFAGGDQASAIHALERACMPACVANLDNCDQPVFWQIHYEPSFGCPSEERIGNAGDGGKWVCDPNKVAEGAKGKSGCLVYSIGSNGQFDFEQAVNDRISPNCEIHTIDMNDWNNYTSTPPPPYVNYHVYTVGPSPNTPIPTIVSQLGHAGRTIDIFKIDCEGCEWGTFRSWFGQGVNIRQILVEIHGIRGPTSTGESATTAEEFFNFLFDMGYVVFHKEPNTLANSLERKGSLIANTLANFWEPKGSLIEPIEYAFLKLDSAFVHATDGRGTL